MSSAKRTTSGESSISDNSGVPAASELFEAIQKWAERDPGSALETIELIRDHLKGALEPPKGGPPPPKKRAICLAGGGPASGLHIGALKGLQERGLTFDHEGDVWALSCIGAWVGIVYNQAPQGREIEETIRFFCDVFRNDQSFKSFPANTVFTPDWAGNAEAMLDFLVDPRNYRNAFVPREIAKSFMHTMSAIRRGSTMRRHSRTYGNEEFAEYEFKEFSEGDFNRWTLNHVLAVNPAVRFLTALLYKSKVNGLSRLYYPDSSFLNKIRFDEVRKRAPFIYYNAWNLSRQELVLFANKEKNAKLAPKSRYAVNVEGYRPIDAASLCACSALPFIEQTVTIGGDIYCEGALIDTVNLENLLVDHPDLEEIWISRIVDAGQVLPPRNLHDSLANLCELFCATVGEDDIEMFKCRLQHENPERWKKIKIIEIPVDCTINFEWSHSNLEHGIKAGEAAAKRTYDYYLQVKHDEDITVITPPVSDAEQRQRQHRRRELARKRLIEAGRSDC
jgi:predicted acylesterase/phospholipase RssA